MARREVRAPFRAIGCRPPRSRGQNGKAPGRTEAIVAVAPGSTATRIEHQIDPAPPCQLLDAIDDTVGTGIDQPLNASAEQEIVLCHRGNTDYMRTDDLRKIDS